MSWTLGNNVENLRLTGSAVVAGTGNALDNLIDGNGAANTLIGAAGNDTLNGGAGIDTLIGGTGNDIYVADNAADVITESVGEGLDTVQSSVSLTLGINVENLSLTGVAVLNGTGNAQNNVLTGNSAANVLSGAAGNDTLDGGAGNDTLAGGTGADIYRFGAGYGADTVQENDTALNVKDAVQFLGTIKQADVQFRQVGNNLEVLLNNTTDKLLIQDWYLGSAFHVEEFRFSDNTVLLDSQVQGLVAAMAIFALPTAGIESAPLGRSAHNYMVTPQLVNPALV